MVSRLDIDDFVNYEKEYRPYVKKAVVIAGKMTGLCPFHSDRKNSFSVDLKTGKWHCFSEEIGGNFLDFYAKIHGTDTTTAYKQILKDYGKDEDHPEDKNYSLEQYAKEKHLPADWLKEFCLLETCRDRKTGTSYMKIPYFNAAGKSLVYRKRYANKEFRWSYGASGKIGLYGEWRLPGVSAGDPMILEEGESDAQSLWFMGFNALGVPGASMFKQTHAAMLMGLTLYLHKEKDAGGDTFFRKTMDGLRRGGYEGNIYVFSCGDIPGCKDPSDVLMQFGAETGRKKIEQLLEKAVLANLKEPDIIPELIHGAPVNLRAPDGWIYDDTGIYKIDSKTYEENLVCATPILLKRRIKSLDLGDEKIEITFLRTERQGRVWRSAILPRSVIFTVKGTSILSDLGCMVTSENAKMVIKFLSALEAANDDVIEWSESTSSFGWQTGGRFIPGNSDDIVLDIDQAQGAIAAAYHTEGTMAGWLQSMRRHRENNKFRFILAAAFAAPLLKLLHQRTFFVYNWGDARGGKTAALKAALSVWGEPDGLMMNFNTTQVGLERTAAFFSDLPLGVDERQAAGTGVYGQSKIENIIYMICEGKGKTRGSKEGGVQKVNRWRTVALATGEEPITNGTSQTGVFSRVIEIYQGPFASESEAGQMHQAAAANYGHAGPAFVKSLTRKDPESLNQKYADMVAFVKSIGDGKAGSHVNSIALIALADALANDWIFTDSKEQQAETVPDLLLQKEVLISSASWAKACEMAKEIMQEQMSAAAADVNANATQFLVDWVSQNQAYFGSDAIGTCLGMMSDDGNIAYIYTSAMNQALRQAGYSENKTKKYLADKHLITTIERSDHCGVTYTVVKRFHGRAQRFVEFFVGKASGLMDDTDSQDFSQIDDDSELPFE